MLRARFSGAQLALRNIRHLSTPPPTIHPHLVQAFHAELRRSRNWGWFMAGAGVTGATLGLLFHPIHYSDLQGYEGWLAHEVEWRDKAVRAVPAPAPPKDVHLASSDLGELPRAVVSAHLRTMGYSEATVAAATGGTSVKPPASSVVERFVDAPAPTDVTTILARLMSGPPERELLLRRGDYYLLPANARTFVCKVPLTELNEDGTEKSTTWRKNFHKQIPPEVFEQLPPAVRANIEKISEGGLYNADMEYLVFTSMEGRGSYRGLDSLRYNLIQATGWLAASLAAGAIGYRWGLYKVLPETLLQAAEGKFNLGLLFVGRAIMGMPFVLPAVLVPEFAVFNKYRPDHSTDSYYTNEGGWRIQSSRGHSGHYRDGGVTYTMFARATPNDTLRAAHATTATATAASPAPSTTGGATKIVAAAPNEGDGKKKDPSTDASNIALDIYEAVLLTTGGAMIAGFYWVCAAFMGGLVAAPVSLPIGYLVGRRMSTNLAGVLKRHVTSGSAVSTPAAIAAATTAGASGAAAATAATGSGVAAVVEASAASVGKAVGK